MQILNALILLGKSQIIHCDIKPENILLADSTLRSVKLIDFGTSCYVSQKMYSYIQSRFYRAPEIFLGIPYSFPIDMWSFGCVLVELFTGMPLFPAENERELVFFIVELLGEPPKEILAQGSRSNVYFSRDGKLISNKPPKQFVKEKRLKLLLKGADQNMIDLVRDCLYWDPAERITPEEALRSEWFTDESNPAKAVRSGRHRISMDDITKHTPQLKKFIAKKNGVSNY